MSKVKRYEIELKGVNPVYVLLNYYGNADNEDKSNILLTPIDFVDITNNDEAPYCVLKDTFKEDVKLWSQMFNSEEFEPLPLYTKIPCWNCRNTFDTRPLGCPLSYITNVSEDYKKKLFKLKNWPSDGEFEYLITEGIFCTLSCVKTYTFDCLAKHKSSKYKESLTLLPILQKKLFGEYTSIPLAPSWKLTTTYGGHLTPAQYRASFGKITFVETINMKRPLMIGSSFIHHEVSCKT